MKRLNLNALVEEANKCGGCLSHLKTQSGRRRFKRRQTEDPLEMANPYISDEAKILSSKTFRLQAHKTQVFTRPRCPLIRKRLTHVHEVVAVSVVLAERLGLNDHLVRAAALCHDIGHVPCGHQGEMWMAKEMGRPDFCHEKMSPIVCQFIERKGKGLNLCHETYDSAMRHSGDLAIDTMAPEAWVLRYADKFAYLFADYNDIVGRLRYPISQELRDLFNYFGRTQRLRTSAVMAGLIIESREEGRVSFQKSEIAQKFDRLRKLMYEVYPCVTQQNVADLLGPVLEYLKMLKLADPFMLLALMTDDDVIELHQKRMRDITDLNGTALQEIIPYLEKIGTVDLCDPKLDW